MNVNSLLDLAKDSMWNLDLNILSNTESGALPPPRHFDDILSELRITFLPKTQRKAVDVGGAPLVEPTLALYCPIEGGEYVIDLTVKELAQKTGAEVQVVDMAQVAAGEWGSFGKVAAGFRLMNNPLGKVKPGENVPDDDDNYDNRAAFEPFWQALIDSDPPEPAVKGEGTSSASPNKRPRIIYIRDFGLVSSRSHVWFPSLYSAVRARRIGGAGPDSPILNPTTILFGVSPPIDPDKTTGYQYTSSPSKDWEEDASKERAQRLKERKEKWNNGTLLDELPSFEPHIKIPKTRKENKNDPQDPESSAGDDSPYEQELKGYFGSYVVVPATRNTGLERAARQKRRRELNELMLRMAVGVKGGEIERGAAPTTEDNEGLTEGWGERLVTADVLSDVASRAVTMAMISSQEQERVLVTWAELQDAWRAKNLRDEERKAWTSADD